MRHRIARKPTGSALRALGLAILVTGIVAAAAVPAASGQAADKNRYAVHNLVSDGFLPADHVDSHLVNAWGIAASSTSPWWVANNGDTPPTSTLDNGDGVAQFPPTPLVVNVPGGPTGVVFNGGSSFSVTDGTNSGPARFIFATEAGIIRGWNPGVPPPPLSTQTEVGATVAGAIYKGLAIASTPAGDRLYATNFHAGTVDVFDGGWTKLTIAGAFVDPKLPDGYAPFGIQNIGGNIFVTYAKKQDPNAEDELHGQGLGIVDEYSTGGSLLARVASHGTLDAPWGLAVAPDDFGKASGDLLVGNFGSGHISTFSQNGNGKWQPKGQLHGTSGKPLAIDGLWGIGFGNGSGSGDKDDLYFAAGPADEQHGLFGEIGAAG